MHSTSDMQYRSTAHDPFARGGRRGASELFDDSNFGDLAHSQGVVLREIAWTLAGCAAAIVVIDILEALLAAH